ncbi:hypothetical protein ACVRWQ_07550 [Streptococcus phocae subsp. salmonis]|uniref:hypothetical protein n=1 Tax=Streptococcus phocae TaxID=119224 RepID=UPI00126A0C42|nr:hypothetical protein [Streptococcus phocae]
MKPCFKKCLFSTMAAFAFVGPCVTISAQDSSNEQIEFEENFLSNYKKGQHKKLLAFLQEKGIGLERAYFYLHAVADKDFDALLKEFQTKTTEQIKARMTADLINIYSN